jgi:RNA polymerase subunit RPABC4/transcription elongation factor Spt4
MTDLLETFRERASDLASTIDRKGGIRATLESLRRQMAEADRHRAISKVRGDLKRLDQQITEMITAVGVQAVGLQQAGRLSAPELAPLCQHILELKTALVVQEAELAKLEATANMANADPTRRACAKCGKVIPAEGTFCPYCGASAPAPESRRFCIHCGATLRAESRFCAKCGQSAGG